MAELQGYFLLYKDDPLAASNNIESIKSSRISSTHTSRSSPSETVGTATASSVRPQSRRMLTAFEIDKMTFNPQYDWEKDIYSGPK